jgi:hypothetical protein
LQAIIVILYVLLAVLVGLCGRRRRMGFLGFFALALLITPVIALLFLYVSQEPPGASSLRNTR